MFRLDFKECFDSLKEGIRNNKSVIISGVIVFFIAFILCGIIWYKNAYKSVSEEWVMEYMQNYSDSMNEVEIQSLKRNLSEQIDDKMATIDTSSELSDEELTALIKTIYSEMQTANTSLTSDEQLQIAADAVKHILSEYDIDGSQMLLESYEEKIKNMLSEETIRAWLKDTQSTLEAADVLNRYELEVQIKQLANSLNVDETTLKQVLSDIESSNNNISDMATKLGVTEKELKESLEQINISSSADLESLSERINNAQNSLQQQITTNKNNTEETIAQNKAEIEKTVEDNKTAIEKTVEDNKTATDKAISENVTQINQTISELDNRQFLYYEYDESTNTLNLSKDIIEPTKAEEGK